MISPADRKIHQSIGTLIGKARKEQDLTQQELADAVGLSRAAIASIEAGRQNIHIVQLMWIAQALRVDVSELLPVGASGRRSRAQITHLEKRLGKVKDELAAIETRFAELTADP